MGPTLSLYIYIYIYIYIYNKERSRGQPREIEREKDKILFLFSSVLSLIYVVSIVGIRRAKNESSSTRRRLRVSTKNTGFHREFK